MKLLALASAALALLVGGTPKAQAKNLSVAHACPGIVKGIYYYRGSARKWERMMGHRPSKSDFNASLVYSCKYATWVAHTWASRAAKNREEYVHWIATQNDPEYQICAVFGRYCSQAKAVAWCEGKFNPYAENGQYLGTFQMGEHERSIYGHGYTVRAQAEAAYRYFIASGSDWSPWQCKPW